MRNCGIILILIVSFLSAQGQVDGAKIRKQVLRWNNIDSTYKFVNPRDSTVIYLHYLGVVRTRHGRTYKIMTSIWIWGLSHRATTRLLVFNRNNQYVGEYYLGSVYDLPSKIKGNALIFLNDKENPDCDPKIYTSVSFTRGIPKQFFRKCKGPHGDIYSFESEK